MTPEREKIIAAQREKVLRGADRLLSIHPSTQARGWEEFTTELDALIALLAEPALETPSSAPQVEEARQAVWSRIIQIAFDRESGCKGNTPYTPPTDSLLDKLILAATAAGRAEIQEAIETKDRAHAMAIDREFAANERAEAAEAQLAERQEAIDRLTRTQTT